MSTFIIARKSGMTRLFSEAGAAVPVTVLKVGDNEIARQKTADKDGYEAAVIKDGRILRECRQKEVDVDWVSLEPGTPVIIKSISKGKGFAGTIKRHGFKRGPAAHGSKNVRKPGSIGSGYPQRVLKGLKMAGQMGNRHVTHRSSIVAVDQTAGIVLVKGGVPGSRGRTVTIQTL